MVMNITNLTMAHIHAGNASTAGPVVVPLVPTPSEKSSNASGLAMLVTPQSGDQTYT